MTKKQMLWYSFMTDENLANWDAVVSRAVNQSIAAVDAGLRSAPEEGL